MDLAVEGSRNGEYWASGSKGQPATGAGSLRGVVNAARMTRK